MTEIIIESRSGPIVHEWGAGNFGITPAGKPFYSFAVIPVTEEAELKLNLTHLTGARPRLEKEPVTV